MKKFLLLILLFITIHTAQAQNIYIDVQHNWFAITPRLELDLLDTITLVQEKPDADPTKPLLLWQYAGNDKFQPVLLYNPTPGMQYIYPVQKWKVEQIAPNTYKLHMREGEKLVGGKVRKYNMVLFRDDHLLLQKIILVRRP